VELTAPYGHSGAFNSLGSVVRHHLDASNSLEQYDQSQAVLPSRPDLDVQDFVVMNDKLRRQALFEANELAPRHLEERELQSLMAFLRALTDPAANDLRNDLPRSVPSGLSLAE
jgi:cytochrome c peroxidase